MGWQTDSKGWTPSAQTSPDNSHQAFKDQPLGVHQKVPLSASDLLVAVVSPLFAAYPGRLGRLRIRYSRAGVWIPPQTNPQPLAQRHVDLLEDTGKPPLTEVVVDGPPRREVAWQEPPRTAAFQDVEDCVEDGTRAMDPRSTAGLRRRKMRCQVAPFGVGEIGRIYGHATERTLPLSCASYFSDSFSE